MKLNHSDLLSGRIDLSYGGIIIKNSKDISAITRYQDYLDTSEFEPDYVCSDGAAMLYVYVNTSVRLWAKLKE